MSEAFELPNAKRYVQISVFHPQELKPTPAESFK